MTDVDDEPLDVAARDCFEVLGDDAQVPVGPERGEVGTAPELLGQVVEAALGELDVFPGSRVFQNLLEPRWQIVRDERDDHGLFY